MESPPPQEATSTAARPMTAARETSVSAPLGPCRWLVVMVALLVAGTRPHVTAVGSRAAMGWLTLCGLVPRFASIPWPPPRPERWSFLSASWRLSRWPCAAMRPLERDRHFPPRRQAAHFVASLNGLAPSSSVASGECAAKVGRSTVREGGRPERSALVHDVPICSSQQFTGRPSGLPSHPRTLILGGHGRAPAEQHRQPDPGAEGGPHRLLRAAHLRDAPRAPLHGRRRGCGPLPRRPAALRAGREDVKQ